MAFGSDSIEESTFSQRVSEDGTARFEIEIEIEEHGDTLLTLVIPSVHQRVSERGERDDVQSSSEDEGHAHSDPKEPPTD